MLDFLKEPVLAAQEFFVLAGGAFQNIFRRPHYWDDVTLQMDSIGVGSLPIVVLTGFFGGAVMARARTDPQYRAAAVYFLGMLAGRGVDYERIHGVLLEYVRNDADATIRQWAVEGMRYLGKDEVLNELFAAFTEDPSPTVRDRAGVDVRSTETS